MEDQLIIPNALEGVRLDRALAVLLPNLSRARIQTLLQDGDAKIDGKPQKPSLKVKTGQVITLMMPELKPADPQPENIPLDILYEDEDLLVINKPAGMVVHPAAGHYEGTLVNALLYHCEGSLSGIGGVKRPGIVHRLDKDTSGLMLVAKNDTAHNALSAQLATRTMSRRYMALVWGNPAPLMGVVDAPLARHPNNRLYMAVRPEGRESRTHYTARTRYGVTATLVECSLETGRTHQIRVHMNHIKNPIVGDPLYGLQPTAVHGYLRRADAPDDVATPIKAFARQALHAFSLRFEHPRTHEEMEFEVPPPNDFNELVSYFEKISD